MECKWDTYRVLRNVISGHRYIVPSTGDMESLARVVEHFIEDEEKHYEESDGPIDHIYLDLLALKNLIETV